MTSEKQTTDPSHRHVTVREEGNRVIIEVTCPDSYDAIELCEVLAAGIQIYGLRLDDPTAQPNGGVWVVWGEPGRMAGIVTIVRDEMNFSRLTIVEHTT